MTPIAVGHSKTELRIALANSGVLPPVRVSVGGVPFHFQDYLTPDDAEMVAAQLVEVAKAARAREAVRAGA